MYGRSGLDQYRRKMQHWICEQIHCLESRADEEVVTWYYRRSPKIGFQLRKQNQERHAQDQQGHKRVTKVEKCIPEQTEIRAKDHAELVGKQPHLKNVR